MTNTHKVTLTEDEQFFYDNAVASYDPRLESLRSGRTRGAVLLAMAARAGSRLGWTVSWDIDPDADIIPSDSYLVSGAQHWQCDLVDPDGNLLGSLGSVDLGFANGRDGEPAYPEDSGHAKVVAAELMLAALTKGK